MTLQSSSTISTNDINIELGRSGSAQFSFNGSEERGLAGIASGTISLASFYGKSARKATITSVGRNSNDSGGNITYDTHRIGYGALDRVNFYHYEGGQAHNNNAFGSIDKTTGLITSGTLYGVVVVDYEEAQRASGGTVSQFDYHFEIVTSRSSNGGWTSVKVYRQGDTGTQYTFNRTSASKFVSINSPGSPSGKNNTYRWVFTSFTGGAASGNAAYHTASDTVTKMGNVWNMFEYARANNKDIYVEFS
jgi:hypothetical protein